MTRLRVMAGGLVLVLVLVLGANYLSVERDLHEVITSDVRNSGISIHAYHSYLLNPRVIVVDLRGLQSDKSQMDVIRALFQFAEKKRGSHYDKIVLAFRGHPKFALTGEYFRQIGQEYRSENPVYAVRTLPENVRNLDGTPAFETWTGGMLGVLGRQMSDVNEFGRKWYLDDLIRDSKP